MQKEDLKFNDKVFIIDEDSRTRWVRFAFVWKIFEDFVQLQFLHDDCRREFFSRDFESCYKTEKEAIEALKRGLR